MSSGHRRMALFREFGNDRRHPRNHVSLRASGLLWMDFLFGLYLAVLIFFAVDTVLPFFVFHNLFAPQDLGNLERRASTLQTTDIEQEQSISTRQFSGEVLRKYTGDRLFQSFNPEATSDRKQEGFRRRVKDCEMWAVLAATTRELAKSEAVKKVASLSDWCLVLVATDKRNTSVSDFQGGNIVLLADEDQQAIQRELASANIPSSERLGGKNLGYLFAIRHGAKVIYDFAVNFVLRSYDFDNNRVMSPFTLRDDPKLSDSFLVRYLHGASENGSSTIFNPFRPMNPNSNHIWPRGFPLESVPSQTTPAANVKGREWRMGRLPVSSVGVLQSVCNEDPDVDHIFRLTHSLPIQFDGGKTITKVLIPLEDYAPFNNKATVHLQAAFWALLLPSTIPEHVSDIFRSYFSQRIFHDLQLGVLFTPPFVNRVQRTPFNDMEQLQVEVNSMNLKTSALLHFLTNWQDNSTRTESRIENLWIDLYERGYIGIADVEAIEAWLAALTQVGYSFPTFPSEVPKMLVQEQPRMHEQPYVARHWVSEAHSTKESYGHFLASQQLRGTEDDWLDWLSKTSNIGKEGSLSPIWASGSRKVVVKIILMVKNDWPLLKDWLLYHGYLLGFDNLYVLDGSTQKEAISFLMFARDHFGANVIFSKSSLNDLEHEINTIANQIARSCDFILKMDTDEFLAIHKGDKSCSNSSLPADSFDCTLSPYGVDEYLTGDFLSNMADGRRIRTSYHASSSRSKDYCQHSRRIGDVPFGTPHIHTGFKTLHDARSFRKIDLGGHHGSFFSPFTEAQKQDNATKLSVLHAWSRCLHDTVERARNVMIGHGYLRENDNDETSLAKLKKLLRNDKVDVCWLSPEHWPVRSPHKACAYTKALAKCKGLTNQDFYDNAVGGKVNADFRDFLQISMQKHQLR